jgi:adenylate kinase
MIGLFDFLVQITSSVRIIELRDNKPDSADFDLLVLGSEDRFIEEIQSILVFEEKYLIHSPHKRYHVKFNEKIIVLDCLYNYTFGKHGRVFYFDSFLFASRKESMSYAGLHNSDKLVLQEIHILENSWFKKAPIIYKSGGVNLYNRLKNRLVFLFLRSIHFVVNNTIHPTLRVCILGVDGSGKSTVIGLLETDLGCSSVYCGNKENTSTFGHFTRLCRRIVKNHMGFNRESSTLIFDRHVLNELVPSPASVKYSMVRKTLFEMIAVVNKIDLVVVLFGDAEKLAERKTEYNTKQLDYAQNKILELTYNSRVLKINTTEITPFQTKVKIIEALNAI